MPNNTQKSYGAHVVELRNGCRRHKRHAPKWRCALAVLLLVVGCGFSTDESEGRGMDSFAFELEAPASTIPENGPDSPVAQSQGFMLAGMFDEKFLGMQVNWYERHLKIIPARVGTTWFEYYEIRQYEEDQCRWTLRVNLATGSIVEMSIYLVSGCMNNHASESKLKYVPTSIHFMAGPGNHHTATRITLTYEGSRSERYVDWSFVFDPYWFDSEETQRAVEQWRRAIRDVAIESGEDVEVFAMRLVNENILQYGREAINLLATERPIMVRMACGVYPCYY